MGRYRKEYVQKRDSYLRDLKSLQDLGNQHIYKNQTQENVPIESTDETSTAYLRLENDIKLFKSKYHLLFLRKKEYPTTSDILQFGSNPEKMEVVLKTLNERDEIWIENGRLVLKGYEVKLDNGHDKISAKAKEMPALNETGSARNDGKLFSSDSAGLESEIKYFKKKYISFVLKNNTAPSYTDFDNFGLEREKLKLVLGSLIDGNNIYLAKGKYVLKGYEKFIGSSRSAKAPESETAPKPQKIIKKAEPQAENGSGATGDIARSARKGKYQRLKYETVVPEDENKVSGFLESPYIKDYLALLLGYGGTDEAIEVIKAINLNPLMTDKAIESMPDNKISLNAIRRNLTMLRKRGIVSYKMKFNKESGWKTYEWYFPGCKNLKESYIFDMEKRLKEVESEIGKNGNGKYVCGKSGGKHPVLDFGSDELEETDYRCKECGSQLALKEGDEMAEPIKMEISRLREAIEEVNRIEL